MTSTVTCPDCARPATVLSRFTPGADGAEYLRIRCGGGLTLLVAAADIRTPPERAVREPTHPGPRGSGFGSPGSR